MASLAKYKGVHRSSLAVDEELQVELCDIADKEEEVAEAVEVENVEFDFRNSSISSRDEEGCDDIIELKNIHKTYLLGVEGVPALRGYSGYLGC